MAAHVRDLSANNVLLNGVVPRTVTTTVTGTTCDMLQGDGLCNVLLTTDAQSMTALTVLVEESTTTNSAFAYISGATVSATTTTPVAVAFQRTKRYLRPVFQFSGTTAQAAAVFQEQYKVL